MRLIATDNMSTRLYEDGIVKVAMKYAIEWDESEREQWTADLIFFCRIFDWNSRRVFIVIIAMDQWNCWNYSHPCDDVKFCMHDPLTHNGAIQYNCQSPHYRCSAMHRRALKTESCRMTKRNDMRTERHVSPKPHRLKSSSASRHTHTHTHGKHELYHVLGWRLRMQRTTWANEWACK